MITLTQIYENNLYFQGYNYIAGVDEVGRGSWAGPIVAAAVIMPKGEIVKDVKDSKLLTAEKRETLSLKIKKIALAWALGIVDVDYINQYNIGRANIKVFEEAISGLEMKPDYALIDGVAFSTKSPRISRGKRMRGIPCESIVDGDAKIYSIAAASIIAKVARDEILRKEHLRFPEYGFDKNKGYGTKLHQEALAKYGICEIHRILYKPIRKLIKN